MKGAASDLWFSSLVLSPIIMSIWKAQKALFYRLLCFLFFPPGKNWCYENTPNHKPVKFQIKVQPVNPSGWNRWRSEYTHTHKNLDKKIKLSTYQSQIHVKKTHTIHKQWLRIQWRGGQKKEFTEWHSDTYNINTEKINNNQIKTRKQALMKIIAITIHTKTMQKKKCKRINRKQKNCR